MRTALHAFALVLLLVSGFVTHSVSASDAAAADPNIDYVTNEILIKFKAGTPPDRALTVRQAVGASELHVHANIGVHAWRLGQGMSVEKALAILANPGHAQFIEYAEPNYLFHASALPNDPPPALPNDPRFTDLYGLNNVGQTGGTVDADIDAPEAWAAATPSATILVAVIDTGIDYTHDDLKDQIWSDPNETLDGRDDDGNGKVDDVRGWDFVNNDNDPMDDNGHGTHVSGTIAAVRNNGIGVAGVASAVKLIPLKFLDASGAGTSDNAIAAIEYAERVGARISSNSWGGGSRSKALQNAIAASSALFVVAAGNAASSSKQYPAGYDDAKILSVAATDENDALASFSSYGSTWVDLGAPGVDILSTLPNQSYGLFSGTSMATPHVSGAAALVMAQFPAESVAQIKSRLLGAVDRVASLQGKVLTGGRLNVARAIGVEPPLPGGDTQAPGAVTDVSATPTTYHSVTLNWKASGDDDTDGVASAYDVRYLANGTIDASNWANATPVTGEPRPATAGTAQSLLIDGLEPQTAHSVGIKALDDAGNVSPLVSASATTLQAPWSVVNVAPSVSTYRDLDFFGDEPAVGYENGQVRYAYPFGGVWQNELVDANGGSGVSFRFTPTGTPTMSYASGYALKLATRGTSSWTVATIESNKGQGGVVDYTSLAYDSAGYPAISYRNNKSAGLKFARKTATGWHTEFVTAGGTRYNALAFDGSDNPVIAFSDDIAPIDNMLDTLRVARWTGSKWQIDDVDKGVVGYGVFASIAIDDSGRIWVVHGNGNLRYAMFDGVSWTVGDIGPGSYSTVALDASGTPYVGYSNAGQSWVAVLQSDGTWQSELVDLTGGNRTVIQFDGSGVPSALYNARPNGLDLARKNP